MHSHRFLPGALTDQVQLAEMVDRKQNQHAHVDETEQDAIELSSKGGSETRKRASRQEKLKGTNRRNTQ